jgi:hypothetical protein
MEVLLIHKPIGMLTPEMWAGVMQVGKQLLADPSKLVPGAKSMASYGARALNMIICIWEVPNIEVLMPMLEQMSMMGWDTDIIPVDKMEVGMQKAEKALQAMMGKK